MSHIWVRKTPSLSEQAFNFSTLFSLLLLFLSEVLVWCRSSFILLFYFYIFINCYVLFFWSRSVFFSDSVTVYISRWLLLFFFSSIFLVTLDAVNWKHENDRARRERAHAKLEHTWTKHFFFLFLISCLHDPSNTRIAKTLNDEIHIYYYIFSVSLIKCRKNKMLSFI